MWNEIKTDEELNDLKDMMEDFHDSCVKEIHYLSGAFVERDSLAMFPVNNKRIVSVIIQRQAEENTVVELEFSGLKYLKLFPNDEGYTCEILDTSFFWKDGWLYWCDCDGLTAEDMDHYIGTAICASQLRWRRLDNALGEEAVYKPSK